MFSLDAYQSLAKEFAIFPEDEALVYLTLGLTSEAGEVAGKLKKQIRDGVDLQEQMKDELGDVLWYVAVLADELEIDLSTLAAHNIQKLTDRKKRNAISGSGDNR